MRLLADENFPKPIVEALRSEGHDVLWARTELAGSKDVVLLDFAETEARIVLTHYLPKSAEKRVGETSPSRGSPTLRRRLTASH